MTKTLSDHELLSILLEDEYADRLTEEQRYAFMGFYTRSSLTEKQSAWVRGVAERLGIQTAPSENLFSKMAPEKQARQRKAAARVKLPWEK